MFRMTFLCFDSVPLLFDMHIWNTYKELIQRNGLGAYTEKDGLLYWQNRLFTILLIYWIPISFLALVPGVIMSIVGGIPILAIVDVLAVSLVILISFSKRLSILIRKVIFIGILYSVALVLIYYLGTSGPGLLYLLGVTIFIVLIFPAKFGYLSVVTNIIICILLYFAIRFQWLYSATSPFSSVGSWIAVSANLILLSLIFSVLLPKLLNGLQNIIDRQQKLEQELKMHQSNLEVNEKRFRLLLENAGDIIATFDSKGNFIYISPAFERITGYPIEELIDKSFTWIMNQEQENRSVQFFEKILQNPNVPVHTIFPLNHKNGHILWMEGIVTNLLHEDNISAIIGNYRDITEKKEAEEKKRISEIRYQTLFEQAPDAISITDANGQFIEVNTSMCNLLSYSKDEFKDLKIRDILFEEDIELNPPRIQKLKPGEEIRYERRLRSKNGEAVYVDLSGGTMDNGQHLVFVRDVTEKKIAERQKEFDRKNFYALINSTDDLMWSVDKNMDLITCNRAFDDLIQEVTGKSLSEDTAIIKSEFTKEQLARYSTFFERAFAGEVFRTIDHLTSPFEIWSEISFYPIIQGDKIIGCACYSRNITALKMAERERIKMTDDIIRRNENLEQFAYIVSHNLRAPVANISGIIYVLETMNLDKEQEKLMIGELSKSINKLDEVILDLNHILLRKDGHLYQLKETVHFSELVENIQFSIGNMIVEGQFAIVSDFSAVNEFTTTKSYLYSIFYNLISNSIKYRRTDTDSFIRITSKLINNRLVLTFEDNGLGIDLKKKGDQVFGLYKRFHYHTEGKGMGLHMVKTQVEALGGKISIESEVNEGTTFVIEFERSKLS
ncbi:PAS domain S-box protein [Emticicia sp. C21]|uniref:PAS domain-containing sensor histidine kinase n=1 Tax=Emticicia sp. C21 TaxID=2302915 RepID=UPI000E346948|nr:PAS domain S-box protein [Emticicia sp. C21]RFS15162.1 PAS domain S-box protein [Emticicia sp. C21]